MIPRWKRRLGWGSPLRGGRRTHPPAGVVAAAMQPADISVAGEADDDACLPPTQRVPTPTRRKTYKNHQKTNSNGLKTQKQKKIENLKYTNPLVSRKISKKFRACVRVIAAAADTFKRQFYAIDDIQFFHITILDFKSINQQYSATLELSALDRNTGLIFL